MAPRAARSETGVLMRFRARVPCAGCHLPVVCLRRMGTSAASLITCPLRTFRYALADPTASQTRRGVIRDESSILPSQDDLVPDGRLVDLARLERARAHHGLEPLSRVCPLY